MKCYDFKINMTSIGKGYVYADSLEEAKEKINNGDYYDIYDQVGEECSDIIEITEGEDE